MAALVEEVGGPASVLVVILLGEGASVGLVLLQQVGKWPPLLQQVGRWPPLLVQVG